ncbi:hypothetical protein KBD81_01145 [Candidatus Woesebacteria bacterium]|nr:hypothetical protein [Candidatus Woesebacteria bacterium]
MKKEDIHLYLDQFETRIRELRSESKKLIAAQEAREWAEWLFDKKHISLHERASIMERIASLSKISPVQSGSFSYLRKAFMYLFILLLTIFLFGFSLKYIFQILNDRRITDEIPSTIPFHAVLTDAEGKPIDEKTDVVFKIYSTSSSEDPVYTGSCLGESGITPDFKGEFTIQLGSDCSMSPLPAQLFTGMQILYLGVTVSNSQEIKPRYQIPTSVYSQNASRLDSKPVGTERNTIPFINADNVIEFIDENPVLKSTNGEFSLSALSLSFKTLGVDAGDIVFQPGNFANTIVPVGNFGIGTFSPSEKLSVFGHEPNRKMGTFVNLSSESAPEVGVLSLGLGIRDGSKGDYISFYNSTTKDSMGNKIGSISINNSAITYRSAAAGTAEYFETVDVIPDGAIVGLSATGVRKAQSGDVILGVSSSRAAFVGNQAYQNAEKSVLVTLHGQVKLLVSNETDDIKMGDSIELSAIKGVGRKGGGATIGYALTGTNQLATDEFTNVLCPQEARSMRDPKGKNIKCGYISVYLKF